MKKAAMLLALSAATLAIVGCTPEENPRNTQFLTFSTQIKGVGAVQDTRATDTAWQPGDAIGIYMLSQANGNIAQHATHSNVKYTTTGNGDFTAAVGADALRLTRGGNPVSFVAYYPHTTTLSEAHGYAVDVTDQTNFPKIDLLYSDNVTSYVATGVNPRLSFKHKLTKVVFNIVDKREGASLAGMTAAFKGLNSTGVFNLSSGEVTSVGTPRDITPQLKIDGATAVAQAIVLPVDAAAFTVELNIPSDGAANPASFVLPVQNYQPGERHTYTLNVSDGGILINGTGTVENWNDIDGGSLTIDKDPGGGKPVPVISTIANIADVASEGVTDATVAFTVTDSAEGVTATATDNAEWLTVSNVTNTGLTYTVLANGTTSPRTATVTVSYAGATDVTFTVTQLAGSTPPTKPVEAVYYTETFGPRVEGAKSPWPKIADYTGWDVTTVTYGTTTGAGADIRQTSTSDKHVWFPNSGGAAGDNDLVISGLPAGYTGITLTYDVATNAATGNANLMQIFADGVDQTSKVDVPFTGQNVFATVSISIPDGTTTLRFFAPSSTHGGLRLDNISLKGTK